MYHDAYGKEKFELMKQDIPFMEIMSESEEYDIFNTEAIKDFIISSGLILEGTIILRVELFI